MSETKKGQKALVRMVVPGSVSFNYFGVSRVPDIARNILIDFQCSPYIDPGLAQPPGLNNRMVNRIIAGLELRRSRNRSLQEVAFARKFKNNRSGCFHR